MNNPDYANPNTPPSPEPATESAAKVFEATKQKAGEVLQTGERYVRDNPGTSVLSVFGGGLLLGVLIGWGMAREDQDDYTHRTARFLKGWGHRLNLD